MAKFSSIFFSRGKCRIFFSGIDFAIFHFGVFFFLLYFYFGLQWCDTFRQYCTISICDQTIEIIEKHGFLTFVTFFSICYVLWKKKNKQTNNRTTCEGGGGEASTLIATKTLLYHHHHHHGMNVSCFTQIKCIESFFWKRKYAWKWYQKMLSKLHWYHTTNENDAIF